MYGWMGKILRIDLSKGTVKSEALNKEDLKNYIGARGLGTKIFCDEVDPRIDPLSEENKLIFMSGPLTGTAAPSAGRYNVITKGVLNGTIAASNSGGNFGSEMKFAGIDGFIIEGKAKSPVFIWINNDQVQILDAGEIWGKNVVETTDMIKALTDEEAKVACIGPAGENLVKFAGIMNEYNRAAGRSGVGAVMGSKNLKGLPFAVPAGSRWQTPPGLWMLFWMHAQNFRLIRLPDRDWQLWGQMFSSIYLMYMEGFRLKTSARQRYFRKLNRYPESIMPNITWFGIKDALDVPSDAAG